MWLYILSVSYTQAAWQDNMVMDMGRKSFMDMAYHSDNLSCNKVLEGLTWKE